MKSDFQAVIRDIVEQLDAHEIQNCLVGGLAATLQGRMRNTEDVDLVIATDVDEAIRFLQALPSTDDGRQHLRRSPRRRRPRTGSRFP